MSEIITAYPTSGLTDRTFGSINTAFYDYFNSIKNLTDFFEIEKIVGSGYINTYIKFKKSAAYILMAFSSNLELKFINNNSAGNYNSGLTDSMSTVDIPVRYVTGIGGTTVVWIDDYLKGVCMVFNKFEDKFFIANSANDSQYTFYYCDTGSAVNTLKKPFNGDNIGRGGDYVLQPYHHYGINTKDLYTYDGGSGDIPFGKFKLGNAEFIRIYGNFALRLK